MLSYNFTDSTAASPPNPNIHAQEVINAIGAMNPVSPSSVRRANTSSSDRRVLASPAIPLNDFTAPTTLRPEVVTTTTTEMFRRNFSSTRPYMSSIPTVRPIMSIVTGAPSASFRPTPARRTTVASFTGATLDSAAGSEPPSYQDAVGSPPTETSTAAPGDEGG